MDHLELDILGLSEVRWRGNGEIMSDDYVLLYSGGAQHEKGVGFLITKTTRKSVIGCWTISDRVVMIKLKCKPVDINLIQVYAPTSGSSVEDLEEFYGILDYAVKQCKNNEIKIIMGDLNAKVGRGKRNTAEGPFGLGDSIERGDIWNDWCEENSMTVMNTWFKQHERNLYTWKSPGDLFQINF